MRRRSFILSLGVAVTWPSSGHAQQANKVYRIGYLGPGSPVPGLLEQQLEAFRELGWIEGKNIVFERRHAENLTDQLPKLAAELVSLNVDVIFAMGTLGPIAAKQATSTIPIVMGAAGDPVGSGLVASLSRPGGNVTGMSLMAPDLGGKRLELLKELLPNIVRVGLLWNSANPYPALVFNETQKASRVLGLELQSLEVREEAAFEKVFDTARAQRIDALITVEDPLTVSNRKRIVDFAATNRIPAIYGLKEFVEVGGLLSYGANLIDLHRRAIGYVDKILRGTKPADLPVQQPTKFELLVNLKTARTLGIEVPPMLLARADEVIE